MNELEVKEKFELLLPKKDIEFLKKFDEDEKRAKVLKDFIKKKGYEFLESNGLLEEGYEQDGVKLSYKKPFTKKVVDTQALKDEGLYELYTKDSEVSGSVSISFKYED